jgi:translation initiation factor 2 alpha subunit (eIF-2alpha)
MVTRELVERQLVLCTVEKIIGTTVFVKINGDGEGTINTSEIAPGRIRNLRDYVIPGKKIVCMVLSIKGTQIQLSLRRVGMNEKKEFLQKIEKEKSYKSILKTVLGEESTEKVLEKIQEEYNILEFFENIKKDPKIMNKYLNDSESEKIIKILESKKEKLKVIKQIFKLSNKDDDGIIKVKKIISESCQNSDCKINYISAGKYSISISGEDLKNIDTKITKILQSIEKLAKKYHSEFSIEKN